MNFTFKNFLKLCVMIILPLFGMGLVVSTIFAFIFSIFNINNFYIKTVIMVLTCPIWAYLPMKYNVYICQYIVDKQD